MQHFLQKNRIHILFITLIIFLGIAIYGNSIKGKFLWDDRYIVEENPHIQHWSNIPNVFTSTIMEGALSYRPVQILSYMLDYSLWGLDERGFHFSNIILHVLAALGIYWFITMLFGNKALSLITSLLFVAHPVHVGAVSYISGRADPLALIFMLLCFIFYVKYVNSGHIRHYLFVLVFYLLALLSRENSLVLPALLLLYHYSFKKRFRIKYFLPIIGIYLIYGLLRLNVINEPLPHLSSATTLLQRIPGFFAALTDYSRLLFLPFDMHMEYGTILFKFTDPKVITGVLICISLLTYAYMKRNSNRLVFFSVYWFFIGLLPVSNIYPLNAYMAEHWLYLPSIGFFLIAAKAMSYFYSLKRVKALTIGIVGIIIGFYSFLTIKQNIYWREPIPFFIRTLEYAPFSWKAYNGLGTEYSKINKKDEAMAAYKKAVEFSPDYTEAYSNLGVIYSKLGKKDEALTLSRKAVEACPDDARAYNNLGTVYYGLGRKDEAITAYKKAIELRPGFAKAYYNLGVAYRGLDKREDAVDMLNECIKINSRYADAYNELGSAYYALGKKDDAIALYKKAIKLKPKMTTAYNNLGMTYFGVGKVDEAVATFKELIRLDPDSAKACNNLGSVYYNSDRKKDAIFFYKRSVEIDPDYAKAHNNLAIVYYEEKKYNLAIEHCRRATALGYNVSLGLLKNLEQHR